MGEWTYELVYAWSTIPLECQAGGETIWERVLGKGALVAYRSFSFE